MASLEGREGNVDPRRARELPDNSQQGIFQSRQALALLQVAATTVSEGKVAEQG